MDHATQVALIRRLFQLLDARTTELAEAPYANPVSAYTSSARLARERALLLHREPMFVGLESDAAAPGDYFVHDESGIPILVVRTKQGTLNAFIGLCRHRGAPVATGEGRMDGSFRCAYHGWAYDEDGRLVAQPQSIGFSGLAAEDLCLRRLPVAERHGMIFVRPCAGAPIDVDAHLGGAERELGALDLGRHVRFARRSSRRAINWKLAIETFLEAYHVPSLHARSLGAGILGTPAAWDAFGRSGRLVAVRRSLTDLRSLPQSEWNLLDHSVVLYLLFPNTMLIHQIDHVEVVQAHPLSSDESTITYCLYTPAPADDDRARAHFQKNFDLLVAVTEGEDFRVGEEIQRGFHVPGADRVIYGRNEPGVAHYHRMVNDCLAEDRHPD
ncbi:MAG TPA: SRPBCC family protein [Candidatus Binatia bacterium]|nr:SRPBCC family protein [Candidatus Binatia bacterium]